MKQQQGFSLVELMIVVAIIGVLSAVAIPTYQNYIKKAEVGAALASISALKTNVEDYVTTKGSFPDLKVGGEGADKNDSDVSGNLSELGTSEDAFVYGKLSVTADGDDGAGSVQITFGETGSSLTDTDIIKISRDTNGKWKCTLTTNESSLIVPKGCDKAALSG